MEDEETTSPGSEEVTETVVKTPTETPVVEEDALHPSWSELMGALPSSLHSTVTPYLKNRDKNYQDGINKVHSQYADYKPLIENKVPRERIDYALQVAQAIEERPADIIKALQEFTGMSKAEATEVVNGEPGQVETELPDELLQHPKFQEMERMLQTVAQHLVTQKQTEEQAKQDEQLTKDLETLRESKGDFDEEVVLTYAYMNPEKSLEEAVDWAKSKITAALETQRRPAPRVLGQGGGTVNSQITPDQMKNPQDRKAVIAQMLAAGNQA